MKHPYADVNVNMMSQEEFERFKKYLHAQKYPKGCGTNWANGCDDCVERLAEESKK